jgi:hypothetical protein
MFFAATNQTMFTRDGRYGSDPFMPPGSDGALHDRLYDQILLGPGVRHLLATPSFLRLERIRQLGFVSQIWPGATHTRYEHSLGCYALAQRAIQRVLHWYPALDEQPALAFQLASLLHDIGHYGYAHPLEEIGPPLPSHEQVGRSLIEKSEIATLIEREYHLSPGRIADLVDPPKQRALPPDDALLGSLLSGALDIDKLDYLPRDAKACGVPYGWADVPQLLAALRIVPKEHGQPRVVLDHAGIGALSNFLHARQAMYLTVYEHAQNRACQAMLRRAVQDALVQGTITVEQVSRQDDASLLALLACDDHPSSTQMLVQALARQQCYNEVLEISPVARCFPPLVALVNDVWQRRRVEQKIAAALSRMLELDISDHEVLLDLPRPKRWEMEGWFWYPSPPVGCEALVPWSQALGLCSEDLTRYEDARRPLRLFVSARVREWLQTPSRDQLLALVEEGATSGR